MTTAFDILEPALAELKEQKLASVEMKKQKIDTWLSKSERRMLGINKTAEYVTRTVKDIVVKKDDDFVLVDVKRRFGKARIGGQQVVVWSELPEDIWQIDVNKTNDLAFD